MAATMTQSADTLGTMSRQAAVSGRGTGFGTNENVWTRELTEDRRIYYFNRATGVSQWHMPDDLYGAQGDSQASENEYTLVFPTHSKATLRVDCITEVMPKAPEEAQTTAPSGASERMAAFEEHIHDMEKLYAMVPADLSDLLRGEEFRNECEECFRESSETETPIPIVDTYPFVFELSDLLRNEYPLSISLDRMRHVADLFDKSGGASMVSLQDFADFVCVVILAHYLETLDTNLLMT